MDVPTTPRRVGGPPRPIMLTKMLTPWKGGQPAYLRIPGSESLYLACFSTPEKLRCVCERAGRDYDTIKQITDGPDFLDSIFESGQDIKVIVDPWFTIRGTVRYLEVLP